MRPLLPADRAREVLRERGPIVLAFCYFSGIFLDCELCGCSAPMEVLCGGLARDPGSFVCWDCIERHSDYEGIARAIRAAARSALLGEFRLQEMEPEGRA